MYWFLLFGGIAIVCFLAAWLVDKYTYSDSASFYAFFGVLAVLIEIVLAISLINKNARFDAFIADYENTVALVETYKGNDYGNMNALSQKIIEINEHIARHKGLSKYKWSSPWYSEKIGNLEPIKFNR